MKKISLILTIITLSIGIFSISHSQNLIPAKVLYVIDGDTIKVLINGKKESVRLIGIDTPESRKNKRAKKQAKQMRTSIYQVIKLGKLSKNFVKSIVKKGDTIYLELDIQPRDFYKRILAYVWLPNGEMLNKKIICSGFAYPLTVPPNVKYEKEFLKCFREAREKKLGLWK